MSDSIESVQLAPHGVVTDIYPAEGNEAGKIDLLHDKDRGEISCYARDNHKKQDLLNFHLTDKQLHMCHSRECLFLKAYIHNQNLKVH